MSFYVFLLKSMSFYVTHFTSAGAGHHLVGAVDDWLGMVSSLGSVDMQLVAGINIVYEVYIAPLQDYETKNKHSTMYVHLCCQLASQLLKLQRHTISLNANHNIFSHDIVQKLQFKGFACVLSVCYLCAVCLCSPCCLPCFLPRVMNSQPAVKQGDGTYKHITQYTRQQDGGQHYFLCMYVHAMLWALMNMESKID